MAKQETKEKYYERRVRRVIDEELSQGGIVRGENAKLEEALGRIKTRLAADLEYLYNRLFPGRAYNHTDFYDF